MSESLDITYYAPGFKIEIEGKELDPEISRSIDTVSITKQLGQADNFSFKVQDKIEDGKFKLMDDKRFSVGKKVSVSIGYHQGKFVKMQGHVEKLEPDFSSGAAYTFEVSGKDKALARLAVESGYKCYTKKKDCDIVKAIAGEMGLSPKVDGTKGAPPEKKEKKGGASNLAFIQKMVMQNKGFEFYVSDGKLVFREANIKGSPIKTLEWGKHLISFSPKVNLSDMITGVIVKWWDEKKQEAIVGEAKVNDETPVGSKKSAGKLAKKMYGDKIKTITDEPVESKDEAKNIAVSVLCDSNKELVTAEAETIGMPEIEPGEMIEIKGTADLFAGEYYIYAATHTIDTQGYRTKFSIRRNTSS